MRRSLLILFLVAAFEPSSWARIPESPACQSHGRATGCAGAFVLCADGHVDREHPCERKKPAASKTKKPKHKHSSVTLRLKPATARGQITDPGEAPPPTDLSDSE